MAVQAVELIREKLAVSNDQDAKIPLRLQAFRQCRSLTILLRGVGGQLSLSTLIAALTYNSYADNDFF